MPVPITEIARWIQGEVSGDSTVTIDGLAKIEEASAGKLAFIANPKYAKFINDTRASAVIVGKDFPETGHTVIRVRDPYFSFLLVAQKFYQKPQVLAPGIHPTAIIGPDTVIGDNPSIGPYVVIGGHCKIGANASIHAGVIIDTAASIGDNCIIYSRVSIREQCQIGNNVIIHNGAVIGSDGFGFAPMDGIYHKLPQMGIVVIEDDVEIGANTTIDRATMGTTIIKKGAKLDNLIQIAHNCEVGSNTVIAGQAGFSGSVKIGANAMIGGQVGCVGHITIGAGAKIGAQSGVTKDVPPGILVSGYPAREHMRAKREEALVLQLPELVKRLKAMEKKIAELQEKLGEAPDQSL